jgi:hypothetical protein
VSSTHYTEDELTLHYYGEGRRRDIVERHLETCAECGVLYRDIAGTLAIIEAPETPPRGDQYGLEVWQRIRHQLPDRQGPWWAGLFERDRLAFAGAAALLVVVAFAAGRVWPLRTANTPAANSTQTAGRASGAPGSIAAGDSRQRILLTSVADHLDRSERVLTDVMNAPARSDISAERRWADDLLDASRLYRQDAIDAGEQSVAVVLDDLERSLLEIVHSPAKITTADLEQIRRRIDAAALLFKVRVMSDELRKREDAPDRSSPRTTTRKTS